MDKPLKKGTLVRVRTTNGGDSIATLVEDYEPTYAATLRSTYDNTFIVEAARLKSLEKLYVPTVHLNGTSADELIRQQRAIRDACTNLIKALADATPHDRDYYVQAPPFSGNEAREQNASSLRWIEQLQEEALARALAIMKQKER
jgi:hypothetical protein